MSEGLHEVVGHGVSDNGLQRFESKSFEFILRFACAPKPLYRKAPNVGAGASGIWEHREETQRPLHETMRLAEAWLM